MLYDPSKISGEISDIVSKICHTDTCIAEIGLINLSNSGSVIVDKSENKGWEVYACSEKGAKFSVIVHFSEAFNTYDELRNRLIQRGLEVRKGTYNFFMDIQK